MYMHREPGRVRRAEAAKSHTVYNQAVQEAARIISNAREQAHQIRVAALMRAEQDAAAIREAARNEGLALANVEFAADEADRRAIGRQRLQVATEEMYERRLKDAS